MTNRCEALVEIFNKKGTYWPCGVEPADNHHRITRARGGKILDKAGETYHLMWLCREHHSYAHDNGDAIKGGLLLEGFVITHQDGRPLYVGPDDYLTKTYGPTAGGREE
jgi:hypothetical protein